MNYSAPPSLLERLGGAMARAMGTRRFHIMAAMFLVYVAVNLFSNFIDEMLKQWGPYARPVPLVVFLVAFGIWTRRARERVIPKVVDQSASVQVCKVLVLFLSPPGKDEPDLPTLVSDLSVKGRISDRSVRDRLQGSWRMPLEAIAAHLSRLEKLVIISSSGPNGTANKVQVFRDLIKHMLPSPEGVEILDITSWLGEPWEKGVNFEDLKSLVEVLVTMEMRLKQTPPYEIMIDITGGQKPSTAAGTVVALGEGRRFQYVSTLDKTVRMYDLTYDTSE
jgi:hypothetical protein